MDMAVPGMLRDWNEPGLKSSCANRLFLFSRLSGFWGLAIGTIVIIGWYAHWTTVIQILPDLPPMKYNTALSFILLGAGLLLLTAQRVRLAAWLGVGVFLMGGLTLAEYLTNRNFGIDQLFVHDYIPTATTFPGRMSPLTSSCFTFLGLALALTAKAPRSKERLTAIGMLACIVAMIAGVALFGFAFGIEAAYGWGAYTRMAAHTATTFLIFSLGLLAWAWSSANHIKFNFLRWLPVTGSVTLLVMIGVISAVSFAQLKNAEDWHKHSYEVLGKAEQFLDDLFDIQRGMRGYVLTDLPATFDTYQEGIKNAPQELARLNKLTRDNPGQQQRLKGLAVDLNHVIAYSGQLIDVRKTQGLQAAVQMESTGQGFALANRTIADLDAFTDVEQSLLNERALVASSNFHNTTHLLILGSGLASLLLILANFMASREMRLRRCTENKLQEIASLQKAILNSANYAIISANVDGVITTFNATAEKWLGYSADEVIGKFAPPIWHDADEIAIHARILSMELGRKIEPGMEVFTAKASRGQSEENEWTFIRKDGSRFPVWLSITALTDITGDITGYLGVISDITERKKTQETLRASEERFRLIVDGVKDYALLMLDPSGRIVSWNTGAERIKGYTADEIIGKHFSCFYLPDALAQGHPDKELRLAAREGRYAEEGWRLRKDGSRFLADVVITAIRDDMGKLLGFAKITRDITNRKAAEEALRLSEQRFSNAFEYAAIGMSLVSLDERWLKVNQALCDLTGYSSEELLSKTFHDVTHPDDLEIDAENKRLLLEGKIRSYSMEKRYFHKQGHEIWVLLSLSLVCDHQNQPLYFISQIEDITESKQAMARQKELTKKAQAAERAKSEFLAVMSHEIRTPMNGVIGMTHILADTELTEMQQDCVHTIQSSGESLLTVINDILDFSKIEAGKLTLESKAFHLRQCVEEALDLFAAQIRIKRLEAVYLIDSEIPSHLLGDAMRLRQILVNLLGNAIKFTAQGEIVIDVQLQSRDKQGCHLLFSVADTGIGIPKEGVEKLFQAFQQVDTSTTRRYGGTGLGLAISKRLTELMGGKMWVESEPGEGSTFFFTAVMEASEVPGPVDQPREPAILKSKSALIVEDHATNRRILETQLKIWGVNTTATSTGRDALKILGEQKFDVALLDFQMPEMDGVTLAREIRKTTSTPLILLSSTGEIITGEDGSLFQFQIFKPIKHTALLHALQRVTGTEVIESKKSSEKQFDGELAARHPLRILLAEDNSVNQKVGLKMLSQLGYTADLAVNGLKAVEAASNSMYDLILMDIQMPEMDGVEATCLVREKLGAKCSYIVALTAEALEGDRERFLSLGFDGYLSKPLRAQALQDTLKLVKPLA